MQLNQIIEAMDELAPQELAEQWDSVGLEVGRINPEIHKIMVALDLSSRTLAEGEQHQVDGFIVHHPLLYKPLTKFRPDHPNDALLAGLIKQDRFLFAAHTNMDKAELGMNQYLAQTLELTKIVPLVPEMEPTFKVTVFIPEENAVKAQKAMAAAGAGVIGDYRECAFRADGTGTFCAGSMTHPYLGRPGECQTVKEIRMEMLAPKRKLTGILKAAAENHPYEEPVIDVYPLHNVSRHGMGRICEYAKEIRFEEFCRKVKTKLAANRLLVSGAPDRIIRKVAVCSGSGGDYIDAALNHGADVYLTGEMNYHRHEYARERGLAVIAAGHRTTELGFITLVADYLERNFPDGPEIVRSQAEPGENYRFF